MEHLSPFVKNVSVVCDRMPPPHLAHSEDGVPDGFSSNDTPGRHTLLHNDAQEMLSSAGLGESRVASSAEIPCLEARPQQSPSPGPWAPC